jgi:2'-5' RNA ligase
VTSILEPFRGRDFGRSPAREVVLYESRLSPSGSSYVAVQRFPLRPGGIDGKMLV